MGKMEKAEKVCELYLAGKTKEEIAEVVGCSPTSINHYLRVGGARQPKRIENALPMIFKMRKENKTLKEISDATGFHQTTISAELNKRGMGYKGYNLDYYEREVDESTLIYADRKPKIFKVEYDGKQYVDITELCGI